MTSCAVALNRLGDEMQQGAGEIEATLALGATARQAALPHLRRSLRSGTIALIDSTKTTGLIFFPGTMVGALLGGAGSRGRSTAQARPALDIARLGHDLGLRLRASPVSQLLNRSPTAPDSTHQPLIRLVLNRGLI